MGTSHMPIGGWRMKSEGNHWREQMGKEWETVDGEVDRCEHDFILSL